MLNTVSEKSVEDFSIELSVGIFLMKKMITRKEEVDCID